MKKIVIAEDDRSSRLILKNAVEALGYLPIMCSDGLRTHHVLQDNPDVAMLITDVIMPNLDGKELVTLIRNNKKLKHIPTLIISGVVGPRAIADLLECGATEFLGKPVKTDLLTQFINKHMEHR